MSTTLCDFDLSLHLDADGLLGGIYEYNPRFQVHGTFGAHCVKERMDMVVTGQYKRERQQSTNTGKAKQNNEEELYRYQDTVLTYKTQQSKNFRFEHTGEHTRIDESVTAELWCDTRLSGIKELDKRESKYVTRHVSCGLFQLPVSQILAIYRANKVPLGHPFMIEATIVDDKIVEAKLMEYVKEDGIDARQMTNEQYGDYIRRAMEETHKGRVKFEVKMNEFSEPLFTRSVFHIQDFQSRTCMATSGAFHAKDGSLTTSQAAKMASSGGARYGTHHHRHHHHHVQEEEPPIVVVLQPGSEANAFTPLSHTSQLGHQKMLECMERCVLQVYCQNFMKLGPNEPEPTYQPANGNVKNLQFPMWVSKMGRGPAISYFSCHDPTTRIYANKATRMEQLRLYGFNEKTERYLEGVLLKASLRRMGLDAKTFECEIRHHFSAENQSHTPSHLFALCEEAISRLGTFAANSAYYTADYRMVRRRAAEGDLAAMIVLDSWDNTILNNSGRSDDCEGQDNTATTIIRAFGTGRQSLGFKWESSVLNAVQLYLKHTVIYDLGATVTSAFYNTSNEAVDLRKGDLPMVGDEMDVRSKCDGHCHALMESLTGCVERLKQGNIAKEKLALLESSPEITQTEAFKKRDGARAMLLLEGTGTIEPRILPVKESFKDNTVLQKKKLAERCFYKALRDRLAMRKEAAMEPNIGEMYNGEGLPHYVETQHPQRRVSDFYNEVVHGCSVELYQKLGIEYSQFAFTRKGDDGAHRYGVKIGDFMRTTERYALMFPFSKATPEWIQSVTQLTECVQHQLPLMAFGRYNDEQYKQTHSRYVTPLGVPKTLDQKTFEKLVHQVALNPSQTIVRLQTRQWKLDEDAEKTKALQTFIAESVGLVTHAYYSEHHLPICDPEIEILCVVDVSVCLASASF